jgi:hypothetical protein
LTVIACPNRRVLAAVLSAAWLLSTGCSESSTEDAAEGSKAEQDAAVSGAADAGVEPDAGEDHVYIVGSALNSPEGWNAYIAAIPRLEEQEIDYSQALEVPGRADVWVWDGKVFIAEAETPTVTRYRVDENLMLVKDGESLSFANTGLTSAQFWNAIWIAPDKAYMNNASAKEYVVWNPRTMTIEGALPRPDIGARDGFEVATSSTNRGAIIRDGKVYHSYYWTDENYETYEPDSRIVVIDVETDELVETIEAPCPGLDVVTQDDDGNLYFSAWTGLPGLTLVLDQPTSCAVKIPAGRDEVDADWTVTWPDVTEGRQAAALRYQGDGFGLLSVFHDEALEYDSKSDPFELIGTENWKTWRFDFEQKTAEPLEGIAANSGAIYLERIAKLSYALVPTTDYKSSIIYEVDAAKAKPLFETRGWSTRLFQLR